MAIDSVLDSLPTKLGIVPSAQVLVPIIDQLAAAAADSGMRGRIAAMAASTSRSAMDDRVLNVLAAGALGVLPGGASLQPTVDPFTGWRVNSFLSALRNAMVLSKPLRETMKTRSGQFIFYPEFYHEFPDSVDQRIAAVARAHAGLGPSSPDLPALYTLGGLFDGAEAQKQLKAMGKGGGGTTCVMTARAVYHAAGCDLIDGSPITVNTPSGPMIDLGTPTRKTRNDGSKYRAYRRGRADTAHNGGKAFEDNNMDVRPHLTIGDIYYVEGTGDHLYLARGGGAVAVHVGIIVGHSGDAYYTVDGGGGSGADVTLSPMRKMIFKKGAGWSFAEQNRGGQWTHDGVTKSYSNSEVEVIKKAGADLSEDAAIRKRLDSDPRFAAIKPNYLKAYRDLMLAIGTDREPICAHQLKIQRENVQRLARIVAGATVGEVRTIHGWWESESYNQLAWAGPKQIAELMRGERGDPGGLARPGGPPGWRLTGRGSVRMVRAASNFPRSPGGLFLGIRP